MRPILRVILLLALLLVPACKDDPVAPPPDNSPKLLALTSREAVLNNLEVGWNKRSPSAIDDLLDDNFTFFLAPGVGGLPVQWGRFDELYSTTNLFNGMPGRPVVRSVHVDIDLGDELVWTPVVPEAFPDETWHTTTVSYSFRLELEPDMIFTSQAGLKAQFTVRQVPEGSRTKWQLVEWRDLGAVNLHAPASMTGVSTWSDIKALYR